MCFFLYLFFIYPKDAFSLTKSVSLTCNEVLKHSKLRLTRFFLSTAKQLAVFAYGSICKCFATKNPTLNKFYE